jgi:hypothetical protein
MQEKMKHRDDVSFSMMIERRDISNGDDENSNDSDTSEVIQIQGRTPENWIETKSVSGCFSCKKEFGLIGFRHHCRACGHVLCSSCSNYFAVIPPYIINLPKPSRKHAKEERNGPLRLCRGCYKRIENLNQFSGSSEFKYDLTEMHRRATQEEDHLLKQFSTDQLSQFRVMQYRVITHKFLRAEQDMLWQNRHYFAGHSNWLVQLVRSINYETIQPQQLAEVVTLLRAKEKNTTCWNLMCGRTCRALDSECAIQMLNQSVRDNGIRKVALEILDGCSKEELLCYLPYLIRHSLYASVVLNWILDKCRDSETIANAFFWELQYYLAPDPKNATTTKTSASHDMLQEVLSQWRLTVPQYMRDRISSGVNLLSMVRGEGTASPLKYYKRDAERPICEDQELGAAQAPSGVLKGRPVPLSHLPTDLKQGAVRLVSVEKKESHSSPLALTFHQGLNVIKLLWKPENIRKDQVVMDLIWLSKIILRREENLDLPIVTYKVRPCSPGDGFIEMVQNCTSLGRIQAEGRDILTWIIDANEHTTESAMDLRDQFVQSCAAYCILSYLLGIGDRHLDNIMLRTDGSLFHIDYGFVLGQDPKPLKKPEMRITPEMVSAMGGVESKAYARFQKLCSQIYNCLRRHINVFVCLLQLLATFESAEFSEETLMYEVNRRFVPGEMDQEAEIHIYRQLEHSTTFSLVYGAIDHFHDPSSVTNRVWRGTLNTATTLVSSLWHVTGLRGEERGTDAPL